jgi:hypothetical protein
MSGGKLGSRSLIIPLIGQKHDIASHLDASPCRHQTKRSPVDLISIVDGYNCGQLLGGEIEPGVEVNGTSGPVDFSGPAGRWET